MRTSPSCTHPRCAIAMTKNASGGCCEDISSLHGKRADESAAVLHRNRLGHGRPPQHPRIHALRHLARDGRKSCARQRREDLYTRSCGSARAHARLFAIGAMSRRGTAGTQIRRRRGGRRGGTVGGGHAGEWQVATPYGASSSRFARTTAGGVAVRALYRAARRGVVGRAIGEVIDSRYFGPVAVDGLSRRMALVATLGEGV